MAIVGEVNAGKSALFNALVGRARALVSPEPGTTRDYVEAPVVWDGVAVTLVDTAGWRADAAGLEAAGIAMGQARAAECEVVLDVVAADQPARAPRAPSGW
ncbi:MAG: GTPase [Kofleriaceae bacterium]